MCPLLPGPYFSLSFSILRIMYQIAPGPFFLVFINGKGANTNDVSLGPNRWGILLGTWCHMAPVTWAKMVPMPLSRASHTRGVWETCFFNHSLKWKEMTLLWSVKTPKMQVCLNSENTFATAAFGRKFLLQPSSCPCTPSGSRFRCFTWKNVVISKNLHFFDFFFIYKMV